MSLSKPEIDFPGGEPPAELQIRDIVVGDGAEAKAGAVVEVHYVGVTFSTGEEFDASWNRGQTFRFPLGAGRVIKGWDQGVQGMKVGGRQISTAIGSNSEQITSAGFTGVTIAVEVLTG
ncbi:FKBP-type peptidyl-prolyl cis-trans isomerase, partial [Kitasatospora sp. NPDC007106]|uniref:FKBP-type peptidyl-prolyl cis-trans isomerase n=1 Tax=Kitasatospora sp. NPDC007106 TaxID=3156914 RepID=UPI0033F8FA2A